MAACGGTWHSPAQVLFWGPSGTGMGTVCDGVGYSDRPLSPAGSPVWTAHVCPRFGPCGLTSPGLAAFLSGTPAPYFLLEGVLAGLSGPF